MFQTHLLSLGRTRAEVVPERGAIVTRLTVDGREILYMDHETLFDPAKNVRGGVPVLFPFAGRLPGDHFPPAGTTIKQHGFGRNSAWAVAEARDDLLRMTLADSDATRAVWPWSFRAEQVVRLGAHGLSIELTVENRGHAPMPASPGWHPYFNCPTGQKREVRLDVPGFDPARLTEDTEFDFGLRAPVLGHARLDVPGLGALALEHSPRMSHLQLWSQPGKPFVCVEPFWGAAGAVLDPAANDTIAPGRAHDYWMRVSLLP
jgi:galactose mutarotase-like enzyme